MLTYSRGACLSIEIVLASMSILFYLYLYFILLSLVK